ncbi:hypothetical protein ACFL2Z_04150, partial [Candidatus Eisenbacteria bacterium]
RGEKLDPPRVDTANNKAGGAKASAPQPSQGEPESHKIPEAADAAPKQTEKPAPAEPEEEGHA